MIDIVLLAACITLYSTGIVGFIREARHPDFEEMGAASRLGTLWLIASVLLGYLVNALLDLNWAWAIAIAIAAHFLSWPVMWLIIYPLVGEKGDE